MYIDNSISLSEAITVYIDWKSTYTTTAKQSYQIRLNDLLEFIGKDFLLCDITPIHISSFINYLKSKKLKDNKYYSLSTISYGIDIIRNFFDFWRGRGKSVINPKEIRRIKHIKKYKEIVTKEDFSKMNGILDENIFDDLIKKLVINLLWDTGMRVSELCNIRISDIHSSNTSGKRTAIINTRKTMRYNLVVWSSATNLLLDKYLETRNNIDLNHDFLFVSFKNKTGLTSRSVERWIKHLSKDSKLDKLITPHSFRHGKAHHLLDNGANHRDVVAILRHSSPVSTFHYLSLNEKRYLEVASKYLN